jgi:IS605 OrfB family transposase
LETDALIFLGDIKHLRSRNQNTRGRKFNRKLSGFQYYKLTQYITYKAALAGIKVIQVSEAGKGNIAENAIRKVHGRHKDYSYARSVGKRMLIDAAFNIAYRALGYISKVGVTVNTLKTFASVDRNAMMTKEATYFNRR